MYARTRYAIFGILITKLFLPISSTPIQGQKHETAVELLSDKEGYPYGVVQVGSKEFKIMFDTGGWTSWLASSKSTSACHQGKKKYDENSTTRMSLGQPHNASYAHGTQQGNFVTDTIVLAKKTIRGFPFVEMVISTCGSMPLEEFDGVFGMQKSPSNNGLNTMFIDHAVSCGLAGEKVFSFRFCGSSGTNGFSWFECGDLVLGGFEESFHHQPMIFLPLYRSEHWRIILKSITYGEEDLCKPYHVSVDTGAPITIIPEKVTLKFPQSPPIRGANNGLLYVERSDVRLLQPLKITVGTQTFTIPADAMLMPPPVADYYQYGMQYKLGQNPREWILGISMLRHFHTVFDQQRNQLGLAAVIC